jgi:hypothetical protein
LLTSSFHLEISSCASLATSGYLYVRNRLMVTPILVWRRRSSVARTLLRSPNSLRKEALGSSAAMAFAMALPRSSISLTSMAGNACGPCKCLLSPG